jgi:hypothetical protein
VFGHGAATFGEAEDAVAESDARVMVAVTTSVINTTICLRAQYLTHDARRHRDGDGPALGPQCS